MDHPCVMSDDMEGFHVFAYQTARRVRYVPARADGFGRYMQPLPARVARLTGAAWEHGPLRYLASYSSKAAAIRAGRAMFAGV